MNARARLRGRRSSLDQSCPATRGDRRATINRHAERINNPAQPLIGHAHLAVCVRKINRRMRTDALNVITGQEDGTFTIEADKLAARTIGISKARIGAKTQRLDRSCRLDAQPFYSGDTPFIGSRLDGFDVANGLREHGGSPSVKRMILNRQLALKS